MDRPQVMTLDVMDTGRRRRWTDAEKHRIIEESFAKPRQVAATARRHGVSRSLLTTWRRLHRQGFLGSAGAVRRASRRYRPTTLDDVTRRVRATKVHAH